MRRRRSPPLADDHENREDIESSKTLIALTWKLIARSRRNIAEGRKLFADSFDLLAESRRLVRPRDETSAEPLQAVPFHPGWHPRQPSTTTSVPADIN
jgi:hypothetical protein